MKKTERKTKNTRKAEKLGPGSGGKRPGAGRPPIYADAVTIELRLPAALLRRVADRAIVAKVSTNRMIVYMLTCS